MTSAPRPLVVVLERAVLGAWTVVEVLAEATVVVTEARRAREVGRRRAGRPGAGAARAQARSAPRTALAAP